MAVVVLVVVATGALLYFLPGMVESPAVRERIEQGARDATGRDFGFEDLSFALFPPRLVMKRPVLAGEKEGDPPFLEAADVSLHVAFWPLLARTVVLESLVVEEATVRLVRDASGLRMPAPETKEDAPGETAEPSADGTDGAEGSGVDLAVKEMALRGSRVVLEDRTVSPAVTWDVKDVDLEASIAAPDAPLDFELDAELAGGGLRLAGNADLVSQVGQVELGLEGIGIAPLRPYLPSGREVEGVLSGTVQATGPLVAPERVEADLRLADGKVQLEDIGLVGPLRLGAVLDGLDPVSGTFDVDATEAALDAYDGAFQKPSGRPANVKGRLVPDGRGGLAVDDVELKIHNVDASGRVELGEPLRAKLDVQPFALEGWEVLLPALAEYEPRGTLRPSTLDYTSEPLGIEGRIDLDGVRLVLSESGEIGLQGAIEGTGDGVRLVDVVLTTGAEKVTLKGNVTGLATQPRYALRVGADGAETNTLLSAFTSVKDRLHGPLALDTDLTGRTGDKNLTSLKGHVDFAIRPGQLVGVSLLEKTVGRLGTFGEAALLAAALKGGEKMRRMQRFYGDDFEELAGRFDVAGGWARTENLRMVYPNYRVDLRGKMRLADQRLDFKGQLTIDEEVDEAMSDAAGGKQAQKQRVIQLARVTGTLDSPRVDLSPQTVASWVGGYSGRKVRDKYQERLDEKLGEELGGEVGDLVEGLLGGRR